MFRYLLFLWFVYLCLLYHFIIIQTSRSLPLNFLNLTQLLFFGLRLFLLLAGSFNFIYLGPWVSFYTNDTIKDTLQIFLSHKINLKSKFYLINFNNHSQIKNTFFISSLLNSLSCLGHLSNWGLLGLPNLRRAPSETKQEQGKYKGLF